VTRLHALRLVGTVALLAGCGKAAVEAPMVPAKTAEHEMRAPHRSERPRPNLVAPPPAYGNKVVMAKSTDGATLN